MDTSGARTSDYGLQLREKQKSSACTVFGKAIPPLLKPLMARRATPVRICCSCWSHASTTSCIVWLWFHTCEARQLVAQAITVNGQSVNIPSYLVKVGDVVAVREKSKKQARITEALQLAAQVGMPAWVDVNADKAEGVFKKVPDRDEFGADINESLIVELYSR